MVEARKKYNHMDNLVARATGYSEDVLIYLDKIRHDIDKLELLVDDELWPLPKYREVMTKGGNPKTPPFRIRSCFPAVRRPPSHQTIFRPCPASASCNRRS